MPAPHVVLMLRAIQAWDRFRLRRVMRRHPGLRIHPGASANLAFAEFDLAEGARLDIGPGVDTDRRKGGLRFIVGPGAHVVIGEGCWLRSHLAPTIIVAFDGGRLELGPRCWLSGCHLSAKQSLVVGRETLIGPGSRVFDSDQHDLDETRRERTAAVRIGDYVWIATDVLVFKGVEIGSHSVVGARSIVTRSLPDHSLATGSPAQVVSELGDRSGLPHI
jgi:acetyltransferase-like isoleucine patch superfamily enzyme